MTDDNSLSRRDSLKGIAIGTALGTTALGGTGTAAGGDRDTHGHDNEDDGQVEHDDIRLIPECTEPALDVAAFRVDNHTEQAVDLEWQTERTEPKKDDVLTFIDCETVRIVGDFVDVFLNAAFVDEAGIGTLFEPVGSVEGERTINVAEEFPGIADEALAGPVITVVSLFRDEPGPGDPDVSRVHPDVFQCGDQMLAEAGLTPADVGVEDGFKEVPEPHLSDTGTFTTPSKDSSYLLLRAPGGSVTVRLLCSGDEIARESSDTETGCREKLHGNVDVTSLAAIVGMLDDGDPRP